MPGPEEVPPRQPEFTWNLAKRIVDAIKGERGTLAVMAVSAILGEFARGFEPPQPAAICIEGWGDTGRTIWHGFASVDDAEEFARSLPNPLTVFEMDGRYTWHPVTSTKEAKANG